MQQATGLDEAVVPDKDQVQQSPRAATNWVIALRFAAVLAMVAAFYLYFVVAGEGEAPGTFSVTSWAWMLLPPAALAGSVYLGFRVPDEDVSGRRVLLSRASAALAITFLVLASLFSLVWLYGEWMDYAIG